MTRVTSRVGQSRSSISVLTEVSISPQAPPDRPSLHALARLALAADHLADLLELLRHPLVGGDDLVEGVGDLALDAELVAGHPHREVADPHGLQRVKQVVEIERLRAVGAGLAGRRRAPGLFRRPDFSCDCHSAPPDEPVVPR